MRKAATAASSRNDLQSELQHEIAGWVWPGMVGLGLFLIFGTEAYGWHWHVHLVALALILLQLPVWLLRQRWHLPAVWFQVLGGLAVTLFALRLVPSSAILCLLALPTGLAALLVSAPGGIATAGLSSLIVFRMVSTLPSSQSAGAVPALIAIWATAALIGLSSQFTGRTTESLWASYTRMQQLLEQARDQRVELRQTQEDLVHANEELARLSERLARMYQVAEEARRAKEEFVANVSHELRTPLNMIIGFSEMISEAPDAYGVELPPTLLADVDVILRNSRHLSSLVNDVLDLSQVEAGQMALSKEWTSLTEIASEVVVAVRPLFEAKGLALELDVPGELPPLFCDRTRIRQVLLNLVSNAARFTDRGGVGIRVRTVDRSYIVSVSDSGTGIAPEHQQRIFEPFQQVDGSIRRRFGGTGLGLNISKRFVEMHGGRMWLESQLGSGSVFYFSLPMQEVAPPVAASSATRWLSEDYERGRRRTAPSKAPAPRPAPRFVVLEAGNVLQRLLGRYLGGAEVAAVKSFEQAIEELGRSPAQALILNDPALEQSEASALRRATNLPYGTPAIACWVPGEEEAAARLGVARYLLKPVSREALCSALDALGDQVRTVLLVDDQPEILQLFGRMLASSGRDYRLLRASSGQRALTLLRERKPDAMLLDLVMPGLDGYGVLQEKRSDPRIRDIPVLAVSALDPVRESIIGSSISLTRSGGLTFRDLLTCMRVWSEATPWSERPGDREPPKNPAG